MLLNLNNLLNKKSILLRREAIVRMQREDQTHLYCIKNYLKEKYNIDKNVIDLEIIEIKRLQNDILQQEIKKRHNHSKLYKAKDDGLVDSLKLAT